MHLVWEDWASYVIAILLGCGIGALFVLFIGWRYAMHFPWYVWLLIGWASFPIGLVLLCLFITWRFPHRYGMDE